MTLHYEDGQTALHHGDCLAVMADMPADSIDAIVTDPPYGLGFMGNKWDALPPGKEWAEACLRVLKPGGHLLAFGGSRTWHRLAVAIEDGGFEVRDSIAWMHGQGFPKSGDISKAIDRKAGHQRGSSPDLRNGPNTNPDTKGVGIHGGGFQGMKGDDTGPVSEGAKRWEGWGTALKPSFEPVVVARKPLEGTVAANVMAHGTGAINVDGCRVGRAQGDRTEYGRGKHLPHANTTASLGKFKEVTPYKPDEAGRWPANVILDESQAEALDQQSGVTKSPAPYVQRTTAEGEVFELGSMGNKVGMTSTHHGDSGGASRFFYVAKASKRERPTVDGVSHPTVKPLSLMQWLVRLVTPPGGTVLDPFAGSGTTIEAALTEGFNSIGIELTDEYLPLIQHRIERATETAMF